MTTYRALRQRGAEDLRAVADAPWEETLKLEEFAEANCFSTAALGTAAGALLSERESTTIRGEAS